MLGLLKRVFNKPEKPKAPPPLKKNLIGTITHYYGKVNAAVLKIKNGPLAVGDVVRVYGKNVDYIQAVASMQIDLKPIQKARKGQIIGMGVRKKVHAGDGVYKIPKS